MNPRNLRVLESATPSPLLNLAELIGDHYTIDTFDFAPGDLLLLYTDGIAEARARDGEFFPLAAWMRRQPPTPPRQLLTALHHDLLRHSKGRLDDDIAALAVRLGNP
ncbi:SpoIIE family protein phosphatase [Streptomyces aureus]